MPFHKSPLELFIISFIKQKRRDKTGIKFIRKAISLIDLKLGYCCDNDTPLDLYTPNDNILTRAVKNYLTTMPLQGNKQSLERVKDKLNNFITLCCE